MLCALGTVAGRLADLVEPMDEDIFNPFKARMASRDWEVLCKELRILAFMIIMKIRKDHCAGCSTMVPTRRCSAFRETESYFSIWDNLN